MVERSEAFVGIDVAKKRNAIAIAEAGRNGEVRYLGEVDASPEGMRKGGTGPCRSAVGPANRRNAPATPSCCRPRPCPSRASSTVTAA